MIVKTTPVTHAGATLLHPCFLVLSAQPLPLPLPLSCASPLTTASVPSLVMIVSSLLVPRAAVEGAHFRRFPRHVAVPLCFPVSSLFLLLYVPAFLPLFFSFLLLLLLLATLPFQRCPAPLYGLSHHRHYLVHFIFPISFLSFTLLCSPCSSNIGLPCTSIAVLITITVIIPSLSSLLLLLLCALACLLACFLFCMCYLLCRCLCTLVCVCSAVAFCESVERDRDVSGRSPMLSVLFCFLYSPFVGAVSPSHLRLLPHVSSRIFLHDSCASKPSRLRFSLILVCFMLLCMAVFLCLLISCCVEPPPPSLPPSPFLISTCE